MGQSGKSVGSFLGRLCSILLLILIPMLLTEAFIVKFTLQAIEVHRAAGDEKTENQIVTFADVGDGPRMKEDPVETRRRRGGTRSQDRERKRADEASTEAPEDVEQDEVAQRSIEGTMEEQQSATPSRSSGVRNDDIDGDKDMIKENGAPGINTAGKERGDGDTKDQMNLDNSRDQTANLEKEFRRLLRRNPELFYDLLTNSTSHKHNSSLPGSEMTSPQCGDGEYASIIHSVRSRLGWSRIFEVKYYFNHQGEFRFYICKPCRICSPSTFEILPCSRKSNTVCAASRTGIKCKHDHMVYYPSTGCVPRGSVLATTVSISSAEPPAELVGVHFDSQKPGDVVNFEEGIQTSSLLAGETKTTIITVGVLSLNVLVFIVAMRIWRVKYTRKTGRSHLSGSINNVSSSQTACPPSLRHLREPALPSISNRVNKASATASSVRSSGTLETGGLSSSNCSRGAHSEVPKESNLNIFQEPSYERGAGRVVSIPLLEDPDSANSIVVLRGKHPFWLVMIGKFGPEGGTLACDDSDVILEIPRGAIPPDHPDQLIIARVSLCPDSVGPKLSDSDALWLSPLVELESPGLDRFQKNVTIRLPHRAQLQPGWTFNLHYTDPTADTKRNTQTDVTPSCADQDPEAATCLLGEDLDTKPKWRSVEQNWPPGEAEKPSSGKDVSGVTFSVDGKYFNISTSHFSEYVCSGCSETHPLNLEAVVFWKHYRVEDYEQQMDLSVYIIDIIKDTRKASVENNARSGRQLGVLTGMTGYFALPSLEYTSGEASSLAISVDEECMGNDWKWSLNSFNGVLPAKREMTVESVIRGCCSSKLSTCETFTFVPKDLQLSCFRAMICISQPNSTRGDMNTPILVTVPLAKGYRAVRPDDKSNSINEGLTGPVNDDHIDFVAERLPPSKWCHLYRKLMGKDAQNGIDHIRERNPGDTREQVYNALTSWKRSKGRLATVQNLTTALEQVGLRDLVDEMHEEKAVVIETHL